MPQAERDALVVKNFESVGMGLFETGMAWFWPNWRIERWFKVSGPNTSKRRATTTVACC